MYRMGLWYENHTADSYVGCGMSRLREILGIRRLAIIGMVVGFLANARSVLNFIGIVFDFLQVKTLANKAWEVANKMAAPLWHEQVLLVVGVSCALLLIWDIWLRDFVRWLLAQPDAEPTYCTASEAVSWIAYGEMLSLNVWNKRYGDYEGVFGRDDIPDWHAPLEQAEKALREAARAGKIKIKGKKDGTQVPENVPDDVLAADVVIALYSNGIQIKSGADLQTILDWDVPKYKDLILRQVEVKKLWAQPISKNIQKLRVEDARELHVTLKNYRGLLQVSDPATIQQAYSKFEKTALVFNGNKLLGPYISKVIEVGTPLRAEKFEIANGSSTILDGNDRNELFYKLKQASDVILEETEWALYA